MRPDGRAPNELRRVQLRAGLHRRSPQGSVLVSFGETKVLCTASLDEDVPRWMRGSGKGWVTAEYSMLPGSSPERIRREAQGPAIGSDPGDPAPHRPGAAVGVRHGGAAASVRSSSTATCSRPTAAPGRRRSAAATWRCTTRSPGWSRPRSIAVAPADRPPAPRSRSASSTVSPLLDLAYVEDSRAEVDMNVVMTGSGSLRRGAGHRRGRAVQPGGARRAAGPGRAAGIGEIIDLQREYLDVPPSPPSRRPLSRSAGDRSRDRPRGCVLASANPNKAGSWPRSCDRSGPRCRAGAPAGPTCPRSSRTPTTSRATPG